MLFRNAAARRGGNMRKMNNRDTESGKIALHRPIAVRRPARSAKVAEIK
jgi:hypothetical protein